MAEKKQSWTLTKKGARPITTTLPAEREQLIQHGFKLHEPTAPKAKAAQADAGK